jgi:hypothetical protein
MTDIDHLLAQIGELPLDPRLSGIDGAVFARLAEATQPAIPRAAFGAIAGFAMFAGVLASTLPNAPSHHANLYPLGMPGALAPSTLLGDGQ